MSSTPLTFVGIFALLVFANAAAAQAADTDQTSKAERAEPRSERTTSEGVQTKLRLAARVPTVAARLTRRTFARA
jgi:hypothetical protein